MKKILKLFRVFGKRRNNEWGSIKIMDDGSGEVKVGKKVIFGFYNIKELKKKLKDDTA